MDDAEIDALAEQLLSERPPRTITREQAIGLAQAMQREIDRGCEARAEVAAKQRLPIVCSRGCNGCCEEPVLVYLPEAHAIVAWLMEPAQREVRDAFLAAFPAWQKAAGDGLATLAKLRARGDQDAFLAAHRAQWRKRVLCAFNRDGDCTIYPVRPIDCRNAHAVETHTLCSGANTGEQPAHRLAFEPLDEYRAGTEQVLRAAHHALGGERKMAQSVCEAVHRLLQSAMAAERKAARAGATGSRPGT